MLGRRSVLPPLCAAAAAYLAAAAAAPAQLGCLVLLLQVNGPLRHLLLLLLQPRQCMRCIWVPPEDVLTSLEQQQQAQQQVLHQLQQQQQQQQGELECLRSILLRAVPRLIAVNKRGHDLKAFNDYWNQQQKQRGRSTKRA